MGNLLQDVKYGVRMLRRSPGFAVVAIITLALGIGANTAIFSVINAVLLRPLPFPQPERLMNVVELRSGQLVPEGSTSYPDFADWRSQSRSFEAMAAFHESDFSLTGAGEPQHLTAEIVSVDFFNVLGTQPALGRGFRADEDNPGTRVVVLSDSLWRSRFNADPKIVGRTVTVNARTYTVIGVAPAGFSFPIRSNPQLWTTFGRENEVQPDGEPPMTKNRGAHYLDVIGRLKPGVTVAQAQAEMDLIAHGLARQYPDSNKYRDAARVTPELEHMVGRSRSALLVLLAAVGCVLLIACVNITNLLLARATQRNKEIAIRVSLGAGRWRIVRQLLTESLLLSLGGGVIGLVLAGWGVAMIARLQIAEVPRLSQVGLDSRVFFFAVLVSLLTGIVFGLLPALQVSTPSLNESMKEAGRHASAGRLRSALVIAETAMGLMLLVGAGLLMRSFFQLLRVNPGFESSHVLSLNFILPSARYSDDQQVHFYENLLPKLQTLPGVNSAAAVTPLPLGADRLRISFQIDGRPVAAADEPAAEFRAVSPGYFHTMGIPLLQGRNFTERDDSKAPGVIIINQELARQYFPNENPVGKRMQAEFSITGKPQMREIVGVVGNVKSRSLKQEVDPEYYVPLSQGLISTPSIVVKTAADPWTIAGAVRKQIAAMDSELAVFDVKSMDDYVAASLGQPRFNTLLLGLFASMALLLTAVGLYGVMAYSVAQRTHEIGIRMALGAGRDDVMRMVLRSGLRLTAIGLIIGVLGAAALGRVLASLLYQVKPQDPLTFIAVCGVLVAVGLAATYVPARRAMAVDPMVALRYE